MYVIYNYFETSFNSRLSSSSRCYCELLIEKQFNRNLLYLTKNVVALNHNINTNAFFQLYLILIAYTEFKRIKCSDEQPGARYRNVCPGDNFKNG